MFSFISYIVSLPARILGMGIGKGVVLAPGYPIFRVSYKNIRLGDKIIIGRNSFIQCFGKGKIIIGEETTIGKDVVISSNSFIQIGKNCLFGYRVSLLDHDHKYTYLNRPIVENGLTKGEDILIEDGCFVGAQSFILKGVHLGKNCVVGANSVVTKSFPKKSVIAGNPAQLIRTL
ncbi:MAG: acyltransferase [Candidatus Roizmanbacteria bacterium]|nr:acyltransferase [Candidatus Roizmanbacteria bacterium]